jgi:hypothetical protein
MANKQRWTGRGPATLREGGGGKEQANRRRNAGRAALTEKGNGGGGPKFGEVARSLTSGMDKMN